MVKGPLADRIEYAILEIVFRTPKADYQSHWGSWEYQVKMRVEQYANPLDLLGSFKQLRDSGVLSLTKPDLEGIDHHGFVYSGDAIDDEDFFFTGMFNTVATPLGRRYWNGIESRTRVAIGARC
jgi:hypothetical protein